MIEPIEPVKNVSLKKVKRIAVIAKYNGKQCELTDQLRCTVGTCAVARCTRVQEISGTDPDKYTGRSVISWYQTVDRVIGSKNIRK